MGSCDVCGAPNPDLSFSIRYADFPPRKWASRGALEKNQIGSFDVHLCNRCRWAHFRNEQIVYTGLMLLFVGFLHASDPEARELGWGILFFALVPIALIITRPVLPAGFKDLEAFLFRRHEERLATAHGIDRSRLRLIRSY